MLRSNLTHSVDQAAQRPAGSPKFASSIPPTARGNVAILTAQVLRWYITERDTTSGFLADPRPFGDSNRRAQQAIPGLPRLVTHLPRLAIR